MEILSASDPYQHWQNKYTVPVDVLIDGVLETDPNKGPYCYTSTSADHYGTPFVKLSIKDRTKVEKVRILARDKYFTDDRDYVWGRQSLSFLSGFFP